MESTPSPAPPRAPAARSRAIALASLAFAAISVVLPVLGLPALFAVVLGAIVATGRLRLVVGVLGGLLAFAGFTRFILVYAVPNIIGAGKRSAEEKSVSRLREVLWAEERARELRLVDGDADGEGEFVPLDRLADAEDLLKPGLYVPVAPGVFRVEGYLVQVWVPAARGATGSDAVPADPALAERRWHAYAWPAHAGEAGHRAFFIDQDERICEARGTAYAGVERAPPPFAAFASPSHDAQPCGRGSDGAEWRPWRGKRPRRSG